MVVATRWLCLLGVLLAGTAFAQAPQPLRVQGVIPGGVRLSSTEADGVIYFEVVNEHPDDRLVRVVAFYAKEPDTQYARDLWVPARTTVNAWMPFGPAPATELMPDGKERTQGRSIEYLLIDRTGGKDTVLLPSSEEKVRDRFISYRKREPTTALYVDPEVDPLPPASYPARRTDHDEEIRLARVFRDACGLSFNVAVVPVGFMPATPECFAGIDHFILASNNIAPDAPGLMALRHWVQQGGRLWLRLDKVRPEIAAAILGDDLGYSEVDRVKLSNFVVKRLRDGVPISDFTVANLEQPVEFVRTLVSEQDAVISTIDGWPVTFTRPIGRGKVICTTLGPRGWHRERRAKDSQPTYYEMRDMPVKHEHFDALANEFRALQTTATFTTDDLRPLLTEDIGYQIVSQKTATLVLLGFVLSVLGVGLYLRRGAHPERLGWIGPLLAGVAAVTFFVLGVQSRQAVPPTAAAVQIVDAVPGTGEASVSGLFAVYRPSSGDVPLTTSAIGKLDLELTGLEGQTRRRVQTDLGSWHWDPLALPAGVRMGPFRITTKPGILRATAQFTPKGLEGRLQTPGFYDLTDAMAVTPTLEPLGVRLQGEQFLAGHDEELGVGQFVAGTVLTDQQQRRQAIYQKLLTPPVPEHLDNRQMFFAWAKSEQVPFTTGEGTRNMVTTLLQLPLELERTPPGTKVYVPRPFIPVRRVLEKGFVRPTVEAINAVNQELRFQMPASILPMQVDKVILHVRAKAPGRMLTIAAFDGKTATPLTKVDSATEPIRLEITDVKYLQLDETGGWHVQLSIASADPSQPSDSRWKLESVTVEVFGQTR